MPSAAADHALLEILAGFDRLRMYRNGRIELVSDGEQLWVEVGRRLEKAFLVTE